MISFSLYAYKLLSLGHQIFTYIFCSFSWLLIINSLFHNKLEFIMKADLLYLSLPSLLQCPCFCPPSILSCPRYLSASTPPSLSTPTVHLCRSFPLALWFSIHLSSPLSIAFSLCLLCLSVGVEGSLCSRCILSCLCCLSHLYYRRGYLWQDWLSCI